VYPHACEILIKGSVEVALEDAAEMAD